MLELVSSHRSFDGEQRFYSHQSETIGLKMRFSVFVPNAALKGRQVATLFYLAGLTCTEETFPTKAGAQRLASELGFMLVSPDTSPRGAGVEDESADWDLGVGAGFYVDATHGDWQQHYRMYSYVSEELYKLVVDQFPADPERIGIFGHSMGGHGALVLALRNPQKYKSVSAFAPICAPTRCPWGTKAFGAYLGDDVSSWEAYDASKLMRQQVTPFPAGILVDQGLSDKFLAEQLYPKQFEEACRASQQPLTLRYHEGYDHGYYFISTLIDDHLRFHAKALLSD
ncbi:S-formylglutathione hydrolase [Ralstonia solanacearum]|uniref:S-formylglutathione hydrolase n=1 Tax=Ralstonia solanacearum TaxID=305 RepID=UPI0006DC80FF|nr:S-formylglutathione hydrolase [Ralstonia solanacearum]